MQFLIFDRIGNFIDMIGIFLNDYEKWNVENPQRNQ
jgi:hypothetical protein